VANSETDINGWCMGFNPEYSEDAPTFEQVSNLTGSIILEFGTPWCEHCQAASPSIQKLFSKHSELSHIKIYDGKGKKLGRKFKVKLWPTLIFLKDGLEVDRLVRPLHENEIDRMIIKYK